MAVKLRLMRMGKKKQPTYRIVAADARSPRDGRFLEIVGFYDSRRNPSDLRVDNDKAVKWLKQGAQPTETVEKLLKVSGAWEEFTGQPVVVPVPGKSKSEKKAELKAAEKAKADAEAAVVAEAEAKAAAESAAEEAAVAEAAAAEAPAEEAPAEEAPAVEPAAEEVAAEAPAEDAPTDEAEA